MVRLRLLGFVPLLLTACLASAPPYLCQQGTVSVRAESEETARLVAGFVADVAPRVRDELAGSVQAPLEIWVQDDLRLYALPGAGSAAGGFLVESEGRIHVATARMTGPPGVARIVLAHEIAHASRDEVWARLDPVVEEGLADVIASRAVPDGAADIQAQRLLAVSGADVWISFDDNSPPCLGELRWSSPEGGFFEDLLDGEGVEYHDYGRAFLVVKRLDELDGLRTLRDACERATTEGEVTLEQAAELACVDLAETALAESARQRFDEATLRAALAGVVEPLARLLARRLPPSVGNSKDDFRRMGPSFAIVNGQAGVRGDSVPGLLDAFVRARQQVTTP